MTKPDPRGSLWRKWDLHVHTPASFDWKGGEGPLHAMDDGARFAFFESLIAKVNGSDVAVFSIQDHWTFAGFVALREHLALPEASSLEKLVLPGIEIRVQAPTDFRLNFHFLFSDAVSTERLIAFRHKLTLLEGASVTDDGLRQFARTLPDGTLNRHGIKPEARDDDSEMLRAGLMLAEATQESVERAMSDFGSDQCLIVLAYDTHGGEEDLDWSQHAASDLWFLRSCHLAEARRRSNIDLFLGRRSAGPAALRASFRKSLGGRPRAVTSGSDAHRLGDYGVSPAGKFTWFKADPTFEGLRHVVIEPSSRVFIGEEPAQLSRIRGAKTRYADVVELRKVPGSKLAERWFESRIPLNPGMIAIIGNKGSGKSALADVVALLGNTHRSAMEFLRPERFKAHPNRAKHFEARLTWADGDTGEWLSLNADPDLNSPERVAHLAQSHIEHLCSDVGRDSDFEDELRKVVFQHVPRGERLGTTSLAELIDVVSATSIENAQTLRVQIRQVNKEIVRLQRESSDDALKSLRNALDLRKAELLAHAEAAPDPKQPPAAPSDPTTVANVARVAELELNRDALVKRMRELRVAEADGLRRIAVAERLKGRLEALDKTVLEARDAIALEADQLGIDPDALVSFEVRPDVVIAKLASLTTELEDVRRALGVQPAPGATPEAPVLEKAGDGDSLSADADKPEPKSVAAQLDEANAALESAQRELDAPSQEYEKYKVERALWEATRMELLGSTSDPESARGLASRIRRLQREALAELSQLADRRNRLVRDLYSALAEITRAKARLSDHVQAFVESKRDAIPELDIDFAMSTSIERFPAQFFDCVTHARAGSFSGREAGMERLRELIASHTFETADGAIAFIEDLLRHLQTDVRSGKPADVAKQLKGTTSLSSLYDLLYGLEYVRSSFTIRLDQKPISTLSPGEKGALLVVFYLLLDVSRTPLVIDQPEQNLDNESVYRLLVPAFQDAKERRQIILVTHNPNLAVVCGADQVIHAEIDKTAGQSVSYASGAIENSTVNPELLRVLEGTEPAFRSRERNYRAPAMRSDRLS